MQNNNHKKRFTDNVETLSVNVIDNACRSVYCFNTYKCGFRRVCGISGSEIRETIHKIIQLTECDNTLLSLIKIMTLCFWLFNCKLNIDL